MAKAKTGYVGNEISKNMNNPRNSGKLSRELLQLNLHPPIFHSSRRKIKVFMILPLAIPDCNVDIYADDITLWMANSNPLHIQHGLQGSLNKANHWFSLNKMVPNAKKQNSYLMEPSKNFPTAQTHRLTFRCGAPKLKRPSTKSCLVSR